MPSRDDVESIFRSALKRVEPHAMVSGCCRLDGETLHIRSEDAAVRVDLDAFDEIWICGAGKAAAMMARALVELLGARVTGGLVVTKHGEERAIGPVEVARGGHPVPDGRSESAARRLLDIARAADERSLVLNLISGGGSALLCAPWEGEYGITLEQKQRCTDMLLRSGAEITELNTVRKHLSAIKGGRLAAALRPARVVSLILSDVVGDPLNAIASGPTVADPTTFAEALEIADRYQVATELPAPVVELLEAGAAGAVPETPKPGDSSFERVDNVLIGTNRQGLDAATERARELGYAVLTLTSRLTGEAREVAKLFSGIATEIVRHGEPVAAPACILAGGETTVTLRGTGRGGRNQELSLAFLAELQRAPERYGDLCFLSASTDGNDGPTDAAGAWVDGALLAALGGEAPEAKARVRDALERNDAYTLFDSIEGLFRTGPTGTNVCDYQILLVGRPERPR